MFFFGSSGSTFGISMESIPSLKLALTSSPSNCSPKLKDLLNEANSSIQTIDSEKAVELLGKDNFVFIDLRDKLDEH